MLGMGEKIMYTDLPVYHWMVISNSATLVLLKQVASEWSAYHMRLLTTPSSDIVCNKAPSCSDQTLAQPLLQPEASNKPLGEKASDVMFATWPCRERTQRPLDTSSSCSGLCWNNFQICTQPLEQPLEWKKTNRIMYLPP